MPGNEGRRTPGRATGKSSMKGLHSIRRRRGFTLLEILLAVALIGLLVSTLIATSWHLIGDRAVTPEEVFWEATREARKAALKSEHEHRMSFDDKEKAFVVTDGAVLKTFLVPAGGDELTIDFLPGQQGRNAVLIGGQLVDTRTIPEVSFYADGTCQPFRVQFRRNGPARIISIDPWTCAPVITRSDNPY